MPTSRTKVQACVICGTEFTARWQFNPYRRFALTCSAHCARVLGEQVKRAGGRV